MVWPNNLYSLVFKIIPHKFFKHISFFIISDIQEFYELTLLDDSKSIQQKTTETLLIASKWEQDTVKCTDVSIVWQ